MIKIVIAFINIGPYHLARLLATQKFANSKGFNLKILQVTNNKLEHPWGEINNSLVDDIHTLSFIDKDSVEKVNNKKIPKISQKQVNDYLNQIYPKIVFVPGWSFDISKKIMKWTKNKNVKLVLMSETKADDKKRNFLIEFLKSKLIIPRFSAAIVGGSLHSKYLFNLGMSEESVFLGYDVVDNKFFRKKSNAAKQNKKNILLRHNILDKPFFMVVCRLIKRKNIKRLLKAYSNYKEKYGNNSWNLIICGNGEELNALIAYSKDLGIEKEVKFLGFVSYQEIAELYGLAKCFIHPALSEQWGLVINEAAAAGLPLILSNTVGASNDLLKNNINGFLIDPYREEEISDAMKMIHKSSPNKIKKMGEESYKLVSSFDSKEFGKSVYKIINYLSNK